MLSPDANKHKWIHFVHRTAKIHIQVSGFDRKSHPTLLRDHKAHLRLDHCHLRLHWLLDDGNLRLHRLLNDGNLRRGLNDSNLGSGPAVHSEEFGAKLEPATGVDVDSLLASVGASGSEHAEGHVSLSDLSVALILDNDVHLVLEHVCWDLHPLALPVRVLTTVVAGV